MIPQNWIDATDLNQWANRRDAQARLPQLLRRLIHATVQQPRRVGFPSGESVQMGGWDGIVDAPEGNTFVPDGFSVWELGVNRDVKGKADGDYQKRCTNSLGVVPAETTFVFVTPRRWGGKDDWVREKNDEGIWAEVRAYDTDDLEQWLELAPAVHAWLAQVVGKWTEGGQDISSFWDEWTNSTSQPMNVQLHLAGREKEVEKIQEWLSGFPSKLTIQADSQEEAIAFFAAVIHALPEERRVEYLSRCIIAQNESSWRYFGSTQDPLILIPEFDRLKFLPRGHHILVPISRESSPSKDVLQLPRPDRVGFRQALVDMGLSEERAYAMTKESKRSLLVLRRLLATALEIRSPDWAKSENARSLIPALLAGAWDDTKEADREAIAELARKPYEEVVANLARWRSSSEPPIRPLGNIWQLVSREVSWHLLSRFLVRDDLEAFGSVAISVLRTPDPCYELPPDQRFAANVYGKALPHSGFLRQGLAETVAILATRGLPSDIQDVVSAQDRASAIIRQLLSSDADWQRWASLTYLLPTLAEAAPEAFLEAVDQALVGDSPVLLGMFAEEGLMGASPHTGLFWALETFAWEPRYLSQVALIFAKLVRLDPGGKLLNRPFNSLCEIFLCWNPQTPATLEQRLRVIDTLSVREPEVTWKLLCSLLPEISGGISDPIHRPRWRDWNTNYTPKVTEPEYWQSIDAVVERVLSSAGTNSERWCDVIQRIESLPPKLRNQTIDCLLAVDTTNMQPDTGCINYYIERVIHILDKSGTIERHTIAKLEWMYLPVLSHSRRQTKILHQELSRDPLFFAEILKFIYSSENEHDDSVEPDETRVNRFKLAYKLLKSWHQVPGLTEESRVDLEQLRTWVLQARAACHENGRGKSGDRKIGEVLAYAPNAPDGIWPDVAVREIVEEVSSRELELGIELGVYNKRGVSVKSIGKGGLQERQLTETYRNYATAVGDTHPRTAAMLRRIADSYHSDAHREDIRAELEDF